MKQKDHYIWIFAVLILLGMFMGSSLIAEQTEQPIKIEHPSEIPSPKHQEIQRPMIVNLQKQNLDIPNEKEGSIIIQMKIDLDEIRKELNATPDYFVLFKSQQIENLILTYNLKESTIEGGLPPLKSVPISLTDNKKHTLVYAYKQGALQSVYFDGLLIANSPYSGSLNLLTGSAVKTSRKETQYSKNVQQISISDKAMELTLPILS